MKYRSMIIGCGNIAGALDSGQINSTRAPLTHAKAYRAHDYFDCVACVDPDPVERAKFQKYWSLDHSFSSIDEAVSAEVRVDVISICSPTYYHGAHLEQVLSLKPKLVFCEKPLHVDPLVAREIVQAYKQHDVHLMVNYSRRFDPSLTFFKQSIADGKFGELRAISGWYNKGLLNNGSHLLDLLIFLFGNLSVEHVGDAVCDFKLADVSYPLFLATNKDVPIALSCGNANDFGLIELEFLFSNARVKMLNGGRQWSVESVIDDAIFKGYKSLGPAKVSDGEYMQVFQNALSNIHNCLSKQRQLKSSGEDALCVVQLYSDILEKLKDSPHA
jgi:predicted dehydrogenase